MSYKKNNVLRQKIINVLENVKAIYTLNQRITHFKINTIKTRNSKIYFIKLITQKNIIKAKKDEINNKKIMELIKTIYSLMNRSI